MAQYTMNAVKLYLTSLRDTLPKTIRKLDLNSILRYCLIAGIFIVPFIPLYVSKGMFFPFIAGKSFAFRVLVELMLGGWLFLVFRDSRYRPRFSWILVAYALLMGVTIVADLFGENLFRSLWSNFERMDGLVNYLHFFAYFLVISSVLNTEKLWTRFFQTTLGASVIMALYSFAQLAGSITINQGGVRIDATLGNASYLGLYALFHVFIALVLLAQEKKHTYLRHLYGGLAILNFVVLINTATRGAVIGFLGGMVLSVTLIIFFEKRHLFLRKISFGFLVATVLLGGLLVGLRDTAIVRSNTAVDRIVALSRVQNVLEEQQQSRFRIWEIGWNGFKEHPILGWGQDNFNLVFSKYYDKRMYGQEPWFDRAHNVVLDHLIDGGALGFLSYFSVFAAALYCLWRKKRENDPLFTTTEGALFTGLFAAYFFQNLFIFDQFVSYFLFFSVLAFLHFRTTVRNEEEKTDKHNSFGQKEYVIAVALILGTLIVLYFVSMNGIRANRTLLEAMKPQNQGVVQNIEYFKKALAYDHTVGIMETREQLTQTAMLVAQSTLPEETKQELFTLAKDGMEKQIEKVPGDARYRMFIGNLFMSYGLLDEAIAQLEEAIKIAPEKQHIYFPLGDAYALKGEVEKALDTFRTAFEIEPKNETAPQLYASFAIRISRDEIAEKLLIPQYGTVLLADPAIINAYFLSGQYGKAATILERIVDEKQKDPQARISLAGVYIELERRQDAITQIEKAIELSPSFKEQGEYFINEIRNGRKP